MTNSSYTTIYNTRTVKITSDSIISTGISYNASFISGDLVYFNGQFFDSTSFLSTANISNSNSTIKYDVIGRDSIYFEGGYPVPDVTGSPALTPPSGGRFSFKGETLFIVSSFKDTIPPSAGSTASVSAFGVVTTSLLKQ